jgi:hypothetical protein
MSTPLLDPYHFAITAHSLGHHAAHGRTSKFSESLAARLCDNLGVPVFGHDDGLAIVDAVIDTLRNHIIDGLPAYQAADWFLEK